MAYDRDEAHRLIRQVRERSIGPGLTTLDELAAALDGAVHEVQALAGSVGNLQSALDGQREHIQASVTLGRDLQAKAKEALADARLQERSAVESLATLLEAATARLDQLTTEAAQLKAALADSRAAAATESANQQRQLRALTADVDAARALTNRQAATLTRLAGLPWWKRVFHAE